MRMFSESLRRSVLFIIFLSICSSTASFGQDIEKTIILDSVLIEDEALDQINFAATNYIDRQTLQTAQIRDVGDFLRSVPNISGIRKGGANIDPVVRGYKYSQLNVLLNNGVKIENGCPNRMDPVSSHIEAEDIGNIEIIKGPFSLKYGPAFGGVINLVSENPRPFDKFEIHGNVLYGIESNWGGEKIHGSINGGNNKAYFLVSGGYRNYGDYRSGNLEGQNNTISSSFTKYNYSAKLGYSFKPNHSIIASFDGVHGRDVMYPALSMDEKSDDTHIISLDYSGKDLGNIIKSVDVKLYQSDVHHVMDNRNRPSYETMYMIADVDATNTGGRAVTTMQFSKHLILAGLDYENIYKDGKRTGTMSMMGTISTKTSNLWLDALIRNAGVFAEYRTFFNTFELNASIRGDFNKATSGDTVKLINEGVDYFNDVNSQYFNLSLNVAITKKINSWLDISLAVGRGTRSPNMLERYIKLLPVSFDRYDYLGNPQLKPETNNEIDLTFQSRHEKMGSAYLNFFYSYVEDYVTANLLPPAVVKPQTPGVLGVKQFNNANYITSKGFELGYNTPSRHKLGGGIIAAFTYGVIPEVTKYIISDGEVVDAIEITNDALSEIPPFETTMNIYYRFFKGNLIPKLSLRAVAEQRHTSEAFYESYTPGFALLNFSLFWKISNFAEINTGISNILDRAYYEHLNRRIIGTKENLYEPGRVFFATLYAHF